MKIRASPGTLGGCQHNVVRGVMIITSKPLVFQGEAGEISCSTEWPAQSPRGWALVLHPHPLQGGARENKVVTTIARACVQQGLVAVRPNFRGVGESAGQFDHGVGETDDMLALVAQFRAAYPDVAARLWVLGGFSFGSSVAAQLYSTLRVQAQPLPQLMVLVGSAVQRFRFREVTLPDDALLIHGDNDDVVPLQETLEFARSAKLPVVVVPDAGHFFHGRLTTLKQLVLQRLALLQGNSLVPHD